MKVIKFGGTSVGSANSILSVKRIVEAINEPLIVVVSALGGITDKLFNTSKMAAAGDSSYENEFREIVYRHVEMIKEVIPAGEAQVSLQRQVGELLNELKDIFQGIYLIKDLSQKTSDTIVSYGERLSSIIAAQLTGAEWFDSRRFIKTEKKHSKHVLDTELTTSLVRETFKDMPKRVLVPGFISTDKITGEVTNLGRGGSDYTAAIIAAALDADALEIWTDVDGFMTADPRVISTAYTINELSYVEATELCNFGAKVVYPPTIYPVCHKNIPIIIKNTFNPEGAGTVIKQEVSNPQSKAIKGISSINDTSLITVQGLGMVGVIGVNYRIFKALAKNGISVFLVSQASSENSTSIGVRNADADLACEVLNEEFAQEIEMGEISPIQAEKDLATVAIVGENMKHTPGIAGKLFGTLGRNGINVIACAQGASETNISFVVDSKSLRKSLNVIHDSFFLSEYQVLNLFICGVGTVGGSLIEQIHSQRQKLMQENGLQLNVVGIADASKAMFGREGFDLGRFREELAEKGKESSLDTLRDEIIGMNIFNSVFVDCTASAGVASLYKDLLMHNVSVVAANKIAASSEYENYRELKQIARQRGVKYLFETNVGAGLPIINTILMPLAMAILASRLWDVEVKGCTPKLLYTLQSRRSLFAAKAALGLAEIFLIVTLEAAGAPLIGHLQHYTQPYPTAGQAAYLWGCTFAVDCMIFFSELLLTVLLANPLPALCVGILGTLLGLFSAFMPAWVGYFVPWGYFIPLNTYWIAAWDQANKVVTYMIVPFQWPLLVATVVLAGILFFAAWYAMRNKEV